MLSKTIKSKRKNNSPPKFRSACSEWREGGWGWLKASKSLAWLICFCFLTSCEKDLSLVLPEGEELIVVEGKIEQDQPPVVVLTRSVPVFAPFNQQVIEESFVRNAQVTVTVDGQDFPLTEYSLQQMPPEILQLISEQYGLDLQSGSGPAFNFYFYTTTNLTGELGKNYQLKIEHENEVLTATTSIPYLNPPDSLWFKPHPSPQQDTLIQLWYRYVDPDTIGNSVRYFTKRNNEPFYPGRFLSVFNDELVSGKPYVDFPLDRGEPKMGDVTDDYGYFTRGDSIILKWTAIDVPHYNFWRTLESDQNSTGSPFGSPSTVKSNVKGGLGVWGGYGVSYIRLQAL